MGKAAMLYAARSGSEQRWHHPLRKQPLHRCPRDPSPRQTHRELSLPTQSISACLILACPARVAPQHRLATTSVPASCLHKPSRTFLQSPYPLSRATPAPANFCTHTPNKHLEDTCATTIRILTMAHTAAAQDSPHEVSKRPRGGSIPDSRHAQSRDPCHLHHPQASSKTRTPSSTPLPMPASHLPARDHQTARFPTCQDLPSPMALALEHPLAACPRKRLYR